MRSGRPLGAARRKSHAMAYVATLVAAPGGPALSEEMVASVAECLPQARAAWLDEGAAADIVFAAGELQELGFDGERAMLRALAEDARVTLDGAPVDVIVQPVAHRRKKLFLADMDSTMIGQECIDELAAEVGLKDHVAEITERAMRGELEFEPALRERVALLKGLPENVVDRVIAERITLTPGARALVRTMRAHGVKTALVSGGFTLFTQRIADMIGFDENRANHLVVENGAFAGRVEEPILGKQAKLDALVDLTAKLGIDPRDTMAAGDGANDLAMLQRAGLGVAYHAKPAVAAAAHARIEHGDLTALLYAQGYARADFVA